MLCDNFWRYVSVEPFIKPFYDFFEVICLIFLFVNHKIAYKTLLYDKNAMKHVKDLNPDMPLFESCKQRILYIQKETWSFLSYISNIHIKTLIIIISNKHYGDSFHYITLSLLIHSKYLCYESTAANYSHICTFYTFNSIISYFHQTYKYINCFFLFCLKYLMRFGKDTDKVRYRFEKYWREKTYPKTS